MRLEAIKKIKPSVWPLGLASIRLSDKDKTHNTEQEGSGVIIAWLCDRFLTSLWHFRDTRILGGTFAFATAPLLIVPWFARFFLNTFACLSIKDCSLQSTAVKAEDCHANVILRRHAVDYERHLCTGKSYTPNLQDITGCCSVFTKVSTSDRLSFNQFRPLVGELYACWRQSNLRHLFLFVICC